MYIILIVVSIYIFKLTNIYIFKFFLITKLRLIDFDINMSSYLKRV